MQYSEGTVLPVDPGPGGKQWVKRCMVVDSHEKCESMLLCNDQSIQGSHDVTLCG